MARKKDGEVRRGDICRGLPIFSLIWLGFVGRMAITVVPQLLTTGSVDAGGAIVSAMLIFFYLMVTIVFGIEANKARKLLSHIFEADDAPARKPNMN